jgi:hypothetical protein
MAKKCPGLLFGNFNRRLKIKNHLLILPLN